MIIPSHPTFFNIEEGRISIISVNKSLLKSTYDYELDLFG